MSDIFHGELYGLLCVVRNVSAYRHQLGADGVGEKRLRLMIIVFMKH